MRADDTAMITQGSTGVHSALFYTGIKNMWRAVGSLRTKRGLRAP